jgi:hypothetical protein
MKKLALYCNVWCVVMAIVFLTSLAQIYIIQREEEQILTVVCGTRFFNNFQPKPRGNLDETLLKEGTDGDAVILL